VVSGWGLGSDEFRLSFGLVKEIVAGRGSAPEWTRLRELMGCGRGGSRRSCPAHRMTYKHG
jgi:hypothetical protein